LEVHETGEIVAEAENGKEAVDKALAARPDVVVLEPALPLINGIEATRQIRARVPGAEVLIFTMHTTDSLVREVLEAGVRGFLLKSDARKFLLAAVEGLAVHKPVFTGNVCEALLEPYLTNVARTDPGLTGREKSGRATHRRSPDQQEDRRYSRSA
jgi:DNA-binding NarL/FixJ family response regulator